MKEDSGDSAMLDRVTRTILLRGLGYKQEKIGKMRTPEVSQSTVQRECEDIVRQFNEKLVQLGTDVPEGRKLPEMVDDYQLVNGFLKLIITKESSYDLLNLVSLRIDSVWANKFGVFSTSPRTRQRWEEDPLHY